MAGEDAEAAPPHSPFPRTQAPRPAYRLIPSQFPPIGLFDTVATAADLGRVMELAGWTNDRLVAERIARLPQAEWVYGRSNASIVMASFLHVAPGGMRFNGADLGAWYAAADIRTAAAEVGHHLRREAASRSLPGLRRVYRSYAARLDGAFVDIRRAHAPAGQGPLLDGLYDPRDYARAQPFGEAVRDAALAGGGSETAGIVFDSLRLGGGVNAVAYRPSLVLDVVQADHYAVHVRRDERRIEVERLKAGG
jgi:hypothetical protein